MVIKGTLIVRAVCYITTFHCRYPVGAFGSNQLGGGTLGTFQTLLILSWYFLVLSVRYPVAASGSRLFGANLVQVAGGSSRPQNEASLLSD